MTLQEKIQKMIELGYSYNQLGKICECHSTSLSKWMRGEKNISARMEESIKSHIKSYIENLENIWM